MTVVKSFVIVAAFLVPVNADKCGTAPDNKLMLEQLIKHIRKNSNKKSIKPELLAPVTIRASMAYGVDAMLISRMLAAESRYNPTAINKHSHDYGIAQLNKRTIIRHRIGQKCVNNWICNLNTGVYLLSSFQKLYSTKELNWYCRYNVGTRHYETIKLLCNKYAQRLVATN